MVHDTTEQTAPSPSLRILSDAGTSYTAHMSVAEWVTLSDHPRQRDTERQARKAHWNLARAARGPALESLRWVVAAEFDGRLYKVDGHTRGLLWNTNKLPNPGTVFATVYRCSTRDELNELYATFDTQAASETLYDRVTGAYREQGLTLRSKRLRSGTIVDALSIAIRGVARGEDAAGGTKDDFDIYEAVRVFAPELRLLDTVDPQPETFFTGIVSAGLLSLALDPSTLEFFGQLSRSQGNKKDGLLDPIEGTLCTIRKIKEQRSSWVRLHQENLCATTLGAIDIWQRGESTPGYWSSGKYPPVDLQRALARVQELKRDAFRNT